MRKRIKLINFYYKIPINNLSDDNKGIVRGHLPLECIFGICKSF